MARPAPPAPPRAAAERPREYRTASDLPRAAVYGPADAPDPLRAIGEPGRFPFTRGLYPAGYRGRLWTMRQYAGFGTAAESNHRYRYLLEHGTTGLSVAFDLPTQIGYDSDDPHAAGEVGRVGVAIDSLEDMETLLAEIPLDRISTSMTINATAAILLSLYIAVARRRGIPESALSGTLQNDILKEYVARGTYIYPPAPSLRLVTDVLAYCAREVPRWNPISISGYHIREAGATAPQEIAFTFANALEYVRAAQSAGLDPDHLGERLSFFFACHSDFIEEVAKFRAARRLWARLMQERFGVENPRAQQLRFHVQTGGVTLTAQQPDNNVVRVALQALAAVLGGCQSLHTNGKDEALALPTEASARLALRTQQVIAFESGVADTTDPLGGAYAVEAATEGLEKEARRLLEEIEARGGALRAIEKGEIQSAIQESAYRFQKEVEAGERVIVGLNRFQTEGEEAGPVILRIDPRLEREQVERLRAFKTRRNPGPFRAALRALADHAPTGENLVPYMIEAVLAGATVGEVAGCLREEFGEHRETLIL
jgi:methylmalonyl-CoA mutase N-terminal domain/subunit